MMTVLEEIWEFSKWLWTGFAAGVFAFGVPIVVGMGIFSLVKGCING